MILSEISEDELQAFVDGQLREGRCTTVLAYLGRHPEEIQRLARYALQKDELRRRLDALDLPDDHPTTLRLQHELARRLSRPDFGGWLRWVAMVVLLLAAGWSSNSLYRNYLAHRLPPLVIKAAEAHQVFGEDKTRPVELTAASMAEMSAWFSQRLGEPIEIALLRATGLRLLGGRLLAAENHPVAQLIYEDGTGRRLTLCLSSQPIDLDPAVELVEVDGLTAGYWQDGDLTYALVAETPDEELAAFATQFGAEEPDDLL